MLPKNFIALPSPPPTRRFNFRQREWKQKQREGKMCRKGHRQLPSSILPSDLNFPEVSPWNQNSFLFLHFSFLMRRCAAAAVLYVLPTLPPPFLQFLPRFFLGGKRGTTQKITFSPANFRSLFLPRFGGGYKNMCEDVGRWRKRLQGSEIPRRTNVAFPVPKKSQGVV